MANLISRPEGDATNWHVITGAPCSGKTAVIRELERRGYSVVHEVARAYIASQLAAGLSIAQIQGDKLAFERRLLGEKAAIEKKLGIRDTVFLDRAIPDSIAYFLLSGLNPEEPIELSRRRRYKNIFLLERLPTKKDAVRREDDQTASTIEDLLVNCYRDLGYQLIRLPVSTVANRVDTILEHLE